MNNSSRSESFVHHLVLIGLLVGLLSTSWRGTANTFAQNPQPDLSVGAAARSVADNDVAGNNLPGKEVAGNEQVRQIMETFQGRGVMADGSKPTPPEEALNQFHLRDGFQIELVASEPAVTQPLFLSWDSRGRLWVVHYRQYQFPAGLKVIRYDQHLRAVFDRVPDPPPAGIPGDDMITVHTDTDGDGIYDQHKQVISGLNIASAVQVGAGGIWVLNPPYLLFYPDADRDDVPDGDPVVHLSGFGLQDTHSVANSMMWGPDGWLYGCNGSTTTGDVSSAVTKGVRFQGQCVWRYHPETKVFEIYAEGGGNNFSLDIDSAGRVFAGTNGGNTRGWYFPQGSYSQKNWGKHGPLTNPYAFGFFPPMKFKGDGRRFPQAFCIYEGGLYPDAYEGMILAPNSMQNLVWASRRIPDGSTYRTEDEENLLESDDHWFRPVYAGVGPDGSMYMADWYDSRLSHVSPVDDWHKSSGRVYRVIPEGSRPAYDGADLHTMDVAELLSRLDHPNKWVRQRAVLELGWRGDTEVTDRLVERVESQRSNVSGPRHGTLESLWALNSLGGLSVERAESWLTHADPDIRRWVVRLMGDRREPIDGLARLAADENDVQVRSQLAASAKRLPAEAALPIIQNLLTHEVDLQDPHMPMMIWWALEKHSGRWDLIKAMLRDRSIWQRPMMQEVVASRLMQRYAASGTATELQACAELLSIAPDDTTREQLLIGLSRAFEGRSLPELPDALQQALEQNQASLGQSGLVLGLRQGTASVIGEVIKTLSDPKADLALQLKLVETLGEVPQPAARDILIRLATARSTSEPSLQRVAIGSLASYDDASIATSLIGSFGSRISDEHDLRSTACRTLASRPAWAKRLLDEVTQWRLRVDQVPPDVIQQLRSYEQPEIAHAVETAFGKSVASASPEKLQEMERLQTLLTDAPGRGDAASGKLQFVQRCANCHQLFGEGQKVGPPLDGYERGSTRFWIQNMVDPSLEIREGYQSYLVLTADGRTVTGMIAAQDDATVTLRTAKNEMQKIDREKIEILRALPTSLMPDEILKDATDKQIRDLMAYLMLGA